MFYIPDTNVFIYALARKEPYAGFLRSCILEETLGISVIVAAEFLSGAQAPEEDVFEKLLFEFDTLAVTTDIARTAAKYRKTNQRKGLRLPDALIAATCEAHGATLVTNNIRDYPMTDIEKLSLVVK